ncbi:MAG: InlB B-repeat-containing protein [Oscillospiraceae bacterium]|nr:InlB B-repeat-containing protein [Oscillospiraceae bacterium]
MKRFLSFILSLIMLLSLVPAAAFADTGDVPAQEQTEAAAEPEVTEVPEVTAEPENTAVPEATVSPEPTESPAPSEEPAVLSAEDDGIAVYAAVPVHITLDYNYDGLTEERVCAVGSNYNYVYTDTGSKYSELKDPARTGYIFLGWYDAAEGGSKISYSYKFTEADDGSFTMYAHWEKGITVHFVGNGYKTSINDKTVTPDKVYSSLPYLSSYYYPSNKAFDSWYTDEALTDKVTASTDLSGLDEITLYAGWRNYQYIVKFSIKYSDKSSVTGSMAEVPVDFGVDYIIPECGYSREDYDFVGWSENSYGSTVKYKTGSILNREFVDDYWDGSEDGESFCLYAVWKEDDFSVAFKAIKSALPADGCIRATGSLALPESGDGWTASYSSDSALFSGGSIVALPDTGTQELTITAAVTKDGAVKTRNYKLTVYSAEAADTEAALNKAAAALPSNLRPKYGTDTNILNMLKALIGESDVELAMKDAVQSGDKKSAIAADGTIDYYFSDSMSGGPGYANFTVVLSLNGQSTEKDLRATIPWNTDKVRAALELAAGRVTVPAEVTDSLELTKYPFKEGKTPDDGYSYSTLDTWCTVTWTSADSSVIKIGSAPYYPYYSPYNTTVIPGKLDQDVTLTAALVCSSVDGVAVTKEFTVCVKGDPDAQDITELLQAKLDAGLKDPGLTDDVTGNKIDPENVTSSGIQFPTTRDFKIDGKYYPVTIKSSNPDVIKTSDVNNAARVEVLRPMPGEEPVKVTVTVTITEKATGKFASRDIELTVQPLVNEEIDRELELMELVKAHYFDGIRNANTSPDDIQTDLHAFQEAYLDDDGELVWVYNYKDVTGKGIAPSEMDGWQAAEQWRLFKSSNPKVITHENLLVTRDKEHKLVTITSWLSSERFAELAKKYPDDKRLSQLVNQPVSVQLQVTGTDPTSDKPIEDLYAVYFTLSDNGSEWFSCKLDKLPEGTSALDVLHKALASHGYSASGSTYISAISGPNGTLKEKDRGPNSGWMYSVNGSIASVTMNQYFVSDGDSIEMFYTDDYTKLGHSGEYTPDDVIDLIDAIGTVTKRSGDDIAAARKAYDSLTDEEKKQVTNYGTLLAAEKAYADILKKAAKELGDIYKTTGDYIEKLPGDELNAFGSEWYILGLARSGRKVFDDYYKAIEKYVSENIDENGRLDEKRATDNAKLVLVLSALDKDVTDVGGHDLLKALSDMDYVTQQGLSGAIYALLAFDCRGYDIPSADKNVEQTSREGLVKYILDKQLKDGGWAYSGDKAEPDMTAMALQALAAYYKTDAKVKEAADKAVTCLSKLQNTTGGYDSYGSANSESAAQVITALTALGIDPDNDARFVKNGASVLDSLCGFYVDGGGFRHVSDGKLDPTATAQGYYALAAYYRFAGSQTALYDMTDLDTVEKAA